MIIFFILVNVLIWIIFKFVFFRFFLVRIVIRLVVFFLGKINFVELVKYFLKFNCIEDNLL